MQNSKQKGFTLVELLVVIAIIGLLSTIAIVSLGSARAKARDATRIADMKNFTTALEQYYADKGEYPEALAATGTALGSSVAARLDTAGLGASSGTGTPVYMALIPAYPTPNSNTAISGGSACLGTYTTPTATVANFCYYTSTILTADTQADYKIFYSLDASNVTLGGDQCIITSAGTTCS